MCAWFAGSIRSLIKLRTYGPEPLPFTIPNPSLIAFLQVSLEFLSAKGIKSHVRCAQPSTFKSVIFKTGEYRGDIVDLKLYLTKMDVDEETHRKTLHTYKALRI